MPHLHRKTLLFSCVVLLGGLAGLSRAEFALVANFNDLVCGPVDGQEGWIAASTTTFVTEDPLGANNLVLAITTDSTHLHHALSVPDGATRMFFLRFRFTGQQNYSIGLSNRLYPFQFTDFTVELGMADVDNTLRINDGGSYEMLSPLVSDVWYNAWILVDNETNRSRIFLHSRAGDVATFGDQLAADGQVEFLFRGAAGDLHSFFVKTGGGGSFHLGPLFLDDLYLETTGAINLDNPSVQNSDIDGDGDLDLDDWSTMGTCLHGPGIGEPLEPCSVEQYHRSDLDRDGDVDLRDAGMFVTRFAGE